MGGSLKHRAARNRYTNGVLTKVEAGNVDSQSDADWAAFASAQEVQTDYDAAARPVKQKLVAGGTVYGLTQTSYDGLGRPQCVAQRMNPSEFGSLPGDACALDTEGSFGPDRIVRTIYDAAGRVTQVKAALGVSGVEANEVTTTYGGNGLVATLTDAENVRRPMSMTATTGCSTSVTRSRPRARGRAPRPAVPAPISSNMAMTPPATSSASATAPARRSASATTRSAGWSRRTCPAASST